MQYLPATIFAILLFVIGIALRYGKCEWLIAGFNTMSASERAKYDMVSVRKFVGNILFGLAACLLAFNVGWFFDNVMIIALSWVIFGILVVFALFYTTFSRGGSLPPRIIRDRDHHRKMEQ
jgi:uncharacterized membrane protein